MDADIYFPGEAIGREGKKIPDKTTTVTIDCSHLPDKSQLKDNYQFLYKLKKYCDGLEIIFEGMTEITTIDITTDSGFEADLFAKYIKKPKEKTDITIIKIPITNFI